MLTTRCSSRVLKHISRSSLTKQVAPKSTVVAGVLPPSDNDGRKEKQASFSNLISFASPESDFCSPHVLVKLARADFDQLREVSTETKGQAATEWSGTLSFSSPESDFTSNSEGKYLERLFRSIYLSEI